MKQVKILNFITFLFLFLTLFFGCITLEKIKPFPMIQDLESKDFKLITINEMKNLIFCINFENDLVVLDSNSNILIFKSHFSEDLLAMSVNKENKYLAVSSEYHVYIFDLTNFKLLNTIKSPGRISSVQFSIDSKFIYTEGEQPSIWRWDEASLLLAKPVLKSALFEKCQNDSSRDTRCFREYMKFLAFSNNLEILPSLPGKEEFLNKTKMKGGFFYFSVLPNSPIYIIGNKKQGGSFEVEFWNFKEINLLKKVSFEEKPLLYAIETENGKSEIYIASKKETLKLYYEKSKEVILETKINVPSIIEFLDFFDNQLIMQTADKAIILYSIETNSFKTLKNLNEKFGLIGIRNKDEVLFNDSSNLKSLKINYQENPLTILKFPFKPDIVKMSPDQNYLVLADSSKFTILNLLNNELSFDIKESKKINVFNTEGNYFKSLIKAEEQSKNGELYSGLNIKTLIKYESLRKGVEDLLYDGSTFYRWNAMHRNPIRSLSFSPDSKLLITVSDKEGYHPSEKNVLIWDLVSGKIIFRPENTPDKLSHVQFLDKERYFLVSDLGEISLWNLKKAKKIATFLHNSNASGIAITENNFYRLYGKDILREINFTYNRKSYSFENFDLKFNRPDLVYNEISEKSVELEVSSKLSKIITFRKKQNGMLSENDFIHIPHVKLTNEKKERNVFDRLLTIKFSASDEPSSSLPIIGYKVFVNGVPLYGDYIKRTYPNSDKLINSKEVTIEETIQRSQGENKIEVSAFTEDGVESPRESITVTYNPPTKRKPDLYFVGIGIDDYNLSTSGGLDALKYAVKDSKELEETFQKSGKGSFGNVYSKVISNKEVTQSSIKTLRDFLSKSQVDDHVILFLSGHGIRKDTKVSDLLTAFGETIPEHYKLRNKSDIDDVYYYMTSDSHVDKPWEKGIPIDSIRNLVNGIPSRQKIMLVDTCQSGEKLDLDDKTIASLTKNIEIRKTRGVTAQTRGVKLVTTPGVNTKPEDVEKQVLQTIAKSNLQKEMSELFPELRRGTGTIEISAATGAQSALESSEWKNGAFTYVIKEAILKGKAKDKNGNITARSLRKYILDEVENLTDGQQTPMVARDIAGRDFVIFGK